MKTVLPILLVCLLAIASPAWGQKALVPDDFAFGLVLEAEPNGAFYKTRVPAQAYEKVTRSDLGDMRVFNAKGMAVPHMVAPPEDPAGVAIPPILLPVFPVMDDKTNIRANLDVLVKAGDTVVDVRSARDESHQAPAAYILDLRELQHSPGGLELAVESDEDFLFEVSIHTGDDLVRWERASQSTALASFDFGGHSLVRKYISLDKPHGDYMKISWPVKAKKCRLVSVKAHFLSTSPQASHVLKRLSASGSFDHETGSLIYHSPGLYPVDQIQVEFPVENTLAYVQIYGRRDESGEWNRLSDKSLMYNLRLDDISLQNQHLHIGTSSYRQWMLLFDGWAPKGEDDLPHLVMGWKPHDLTYVGQGPGPFMLAFGSIQVKPPETSRNLLMDSLGNKHGSLLRDSVKSASFKGDMLSLGGEKRLLKDPGPPAWHRYALYGIFLIGLFLVGLMAVNLSRDAARQEKDKAGRRGQVDG